MTLSHLHVIIRRRNGDVIKVIHTVYHGVEIIVEEMDVQGSINITFYSPRGISRE